MLTPDNLRAIRARTDAAIDGPWTVMEDNSGRPATYTVLDGNGMWVAHCGQAPRDAEFIAHARADVTLLLNDHQALGKALNRALDFADGMFRELEALEAESGLMAHKSMMDAHRTILAELAELRAVLIGGA